ncbi:MAG TPA: outer membrane protein assembly factor BamD [Gemmatimonadales bacterium]|nr:outer membrane protein assembly factor BamD [Gemmatimonadales bacterium]
MTRLAGRLLLAGGVLTGCGRHHAAATATPEVNPARTIDSLWKAGEREFAHGRWGRAQRIYDRLAPAMGPTDPRFLHLHFFQGEILYALGEPLQAVREFRRVADEQPDGPLAADALLRAGDAYAELWRIPELDPTYGLSAKSVYEEVLNRYAGTPAAGRASLRLAGLGEKFAQKEYKSALFYFKYKADDSAILMFRSLIATYPRSAVVPGALEHLLRSYQRLGYAEDVKETCAYIAQYHPDPGGPIRLCPKASGQESGVRGQSPPLSPGVERR